MANIKPEGIEIIASNDAPETTEEVIFTSTLTPKGAKGKVNWYIQSRDGKGNIKATYPITSSEPFTQTETLYCGTVYSGGQWKDESLSRTFTARLEGNNLIATITTYDVSGTQHTIVPQTLYIIAEVEGYDIKAEMRIQFEETGGGDPIRPPKPTKP